MRPDLVGIAGAYVARSIEQLQRAFVSSARSRGAIETRHGLDVVIEHVGPRVEHRAQRRLVTLEIRNQDLEPARGNARARFANRPRETATRRNPAGRRDRPR